MEEKEVKKRRGYKTIEQQYEATKRYLSTEKGKENNKYLTYKSRTKVFIKTMVTLEDLSEIKELLNIREEELNKIR